MRFVLLWLALVGIFPSAMLGQPDFTPPSPPDFVPGAAPDFAPTSPPPALVEPFVAANPGENRAIAGNDLVIRVVISGDEPYQYQWFRNGSPVSGATSPALTVAEATPEDTANYLVRITGASGAIAEYSVLVAVEPGGGLLNLATRVFTGEGSALTIAGFGIDGTEDATVIIRALGPSLADEPFFLEGTLSNPSLALYDGAANLIGENDDWVGDSRLSENGLEPQHPGESVIITTLAPGAYTALVNPPPGQSGLSLVEVYELDETNQARLVNLSTRSRVGLGQNAMIAGFVIGGEEERQFILRGIGPSLAEPPFNLPDTLQNPSLEVYSGSGLVEANQDWGSSPNAGAIQSAGLAPSDAREAVVLITLGPGAYTALISGQDGGEGIGLVEVYDVTE